MVKGSRPIFLVQLHIYIRDVSLRLLYLELSYMEFIARSFDIYILGIWDLSGLRIRLIY